MLYYVRSCLHCVQASGIISIFMNIQNLNYTKFRKLCISAKLSGIKTNFCNSASHILMLPSLKCITSKTLHFILSSFGSYRDRNCRTWCLQWNGITSYHPHNHQQARKVYQCPFTAESIKSCTPKQGSQRVWDTPK